MRKSLSRNSVLILLGLFVILSCQVKKKSAGNNSKEIVEVVDENESIIDDEKVIPQPGTINPAQLDSIKRIKNLEKRQKINDSHE